MSGPDLALEKAYFNAAWAGADARIAIKDVLRVPGIPDLRGLRVLICSCGSGRGPVEAANAGAEAHGVDISIEAVRNARAIARFNDVSVCVSVQDLHRLAYPDGTFDVVYGSAVLHHLELDTACLEIRRVLREGGTAFFAQEPTFFNPVLRWSYRIAFGLDRRRRRRRFLFFKRIGTDNEKPFDADDVAVMKRYFPAATATPSGFMFFQKLSHVMGGRGLSATTALDRSLVRFIPGLQQWSYEYSLLLRR